jgi:GlpG protein
MRQIGTLPTNDDARRFVDYLLTQKIPAQIEPEGDSWLIWVQNEDQLTVARDALDHFRQHPTDPIYSDAQAKARQLERAQQAQVKQAKKNVVTMRGRWGGNRSAFKRAPLTCVVIGLCIFVFFLQETSNRQMPPAEQWLSFTRLEPGPTPGEVFVPKDGYRNIRNGEVWRLVTPAFLHFSALHILFNMMMFYTLGSRIEQRYGAWRMGLMILTAAVLSNVAQHAWEGSIRFGGMSGVVYSLFGFAWIKTLYDPQSGIQLDSQTISFAIFWLFLCMVVAVPPLDDLLSFFPKVANTAHFVGLAVGMAIAGMTLAFRRSS